MLKIISKKNLKFYSVGVPFLDVQYNRIIALASSLCRMCRNYEKIENISFAMMLKRTLYSFNHHFGFEEGIMQETAYPNFEEHKNAHYKFFMFFLDQVRSFESRSNFSPEKFACFLQEWLDSHIAMDIALGLYVKNLYYM